MKPRLNPLAYEPFGEASGTVLQGNSGGGDFGWASAWVDQNGSGHIPGHDVESSTPVAYTGLVESGNYAVGGDTWDYVGRQLDTSATGPFAAYLSNGLIGAPGQTVWLSFLLRADVATPDVSFSLGSQGGTNAWWIGNPNLEFGYFGSLSQDSSGHPYWSLAYGGSYATPTAVVPTTVPVTVGQTELFVASINYGADGTDTVNLYMNPSTLGGTAPTTPSVTYTTTNSLAFESLTYYGGTGYNMSSLDEIRLGTSFAAVTPAAPVVIPTVPASLTATPGSGSVTLSWTAVSGATSYNVYQSTTSGGEGSAPVAIGITGTTYTATGLTNGKPYYFEVAAVNSAGIGAISSEATATPSYMAGLPGVPVLAASAGNGQATLSWTAASGASSYNIYEATAAGGEGSTPIATGITDTSYTATGLTNETTYFFQVSATNSVGTSKLSNEVTATPAPPVAGNNAPAIFNIYPQVVADSPVKAGFNMQPASGANITENAWIADGGFSPYDERMSFTASQDGTTTTFIAQYPQPGTDFWSSIVTGYFNGATARTYRYSGGAWSLLRTDTVANYAANGEDETAANNTITFASSGPQILAGDITWLDLDNQASIPSLAYYDARFTAYCPTWMIETQACNTRTSTMPITLSTDVPASDAGGLSLEFTDTNTETNGIRQYVQGAFVGSSYEQFQPGHTYTVDVWLKQSGTNGNVTFFIDSIGVTHTFTGVTDSWKEFTWSFPAVAGLPAGSAQPSVHLDINAPGTMWVDNFQLYDAAWAPNTVSPQAMQAWQNYQPGTVRIWSNFGNSSQNYSFLSLDSWLTPEIKTRNTPGVGNQYEVPAELEHLPDALANVKSIGTANPWLIVNMALSEVEWGELIDYLAAPAGTGYAAKRPANHPGPYTDDFSTIYLEVGNEEWGTQTVPADTAYGAWAHFVLSNAIAGKSYFSASKIKFIANGFDLEPNFGSAAAAAAPEISVVDAALYTQGDQTLTGDAYYQSDLIQVPASNGPIIDALAAQQQLDATKGLNYALASYEQGPGSDTATHQGDTTLAAAIGAIDVNLYATMRGFGPQNLYMYQLGTGPYTSHTNFANGFRPHPVWEALQMRNNYTSGPMVLTTASSVPTTTGSSAYPLIAVYTFRDATVKNQADVVVLSRDLNNQTPVTLNFPATPTGTATLYTLTGDPRVGNDAVLNVPITSTTVSGVTSSYTFNMPPGSMYIFQVPLSSEWSTTGQPTPAAPDSLTASAGNGKVTLTWTASTGATGYYVLRATTTGGPYTQIATSSAVAFTDSTVTNGTTYYYVVQAYNSGGVSGNSDEASATPNVENAAQATATPPLDGSDTGAWANAPFVPISHQFSGDSTDTAAYKVLWDANNLYVLVSVQDSYLIAPTEANIWSGETVELYFSGTDSTSTTYGLTDFQYAFPYGSGGAVITEADHSPSSLTGVTLGQQNITGGFQMAMALPWKTLGTTPVAGKQYGFDLMIDTASVQGTRLGKLGWWATADSTWGNPSLMGPLVLSQAQQTAQTINFTAPSAATYGSTITLSATATSALSPVFTVLSGPATLNGSQLTFTGVGSVVVQASQSGNSTFAAATPVTQTIVVTAATPAITWATPSAITYGTKLTATQLNATTTVAGKFTYSPAVGALLNAGSQTLSASFKPTNATDYTNATASVQLTVNQAKPSLAFSAIASKSYGSAPFKVRASSASSGVVTYSVTSGPATISGSTVTLTGVGLVTLLASQAATTNYTSATSSTSFSVSAETPKLTFSSIPSKVYGSAPFTVKAASASSGVITYSIVSGPALINSSTGLVTLTGLGKVTVEASQAASGVYAATSVTSGFTVTAGTPKLAFASIAAKTYGNAAFTVSASSASSGEVSYKVTSGPATLSGSKVTLTGAGTVHLLASQAATSTYKAATATISIPVAKATPKVTLKASVDSIKLGAPCAFTATLSGVQRGVVPTGSVNFYNGATLLRTVSIRSGVAYYSTQKLPAGSDKITAVYKGNVNYLKATSNAVTISVIAK